MTERKAIQTPKAPAALGPYSQAIRAGSALYLSGQLGIDPESGILVEGGTAAQARQAMSNIREIVSAAGLTLKNIVQVQIFLTDIGDFSAVNEVYKSFFTEPYPARAAIQVAALPAGGRVEILATAQEQPTASAAGRP